MLFAFSLAIKLASTRMSLKDRIWDACKALNTSGKTIGLQTDGSSSKISHCRTINNTNPSHDQHAYAGKTDIYDVLVEQ